MENKEDLFRYMLKARNSVGMYNEYNAYAPNWFQFYDKDEAEEITKMGQELIKESEMKVDNYFKIQEALKDIRDKYPDACIITATQCNRLEEGWTHYNDIEKDDSPAVIFIDHVSLLTLNKTEDENI